MDASNAIEIMQDYDVIVSGSDNFSTAYLVNDAAVLLGKPVAYGSIFRFDGQASTFIPHKGPCFRCLFATATPPELAPSCEEAGVLGVLPGTIGLIQATETIKLLLDVGTTLSGRLLTYDALEMTFRQYKIKRDPECKACGPNARIDLESIADFVCAAQATTRA
jgi:molybdopterin/thiamine biosynthesis adenylyltransferase